MEQALTLGLIRQKYSNLSIAESIRKNLPKKTYSGVNVSSTDYQFFGQQPVPTRVITLSPSGNLMVKFVDAIRKIFSNHQMDTINGNLLGNYILGIHQTESEKRSAEQTLRTAFSQRRDIYIFISEDGNKLFCKVQEVGGCVLF